jgi:hypothetical protein
MCKVNQEGVYTVKEAKQYCLSNYKGLKQQVGPLWLVGRTEEKYRNIKYFYDIRITLYLHLIKKESNI